MISLRVLEQTGAPEILIFLLEKENSRLTDVLIFLRSKRIGQSAMYNALKLLKENKLIEDIITDYPRSRILKITEKGRRVAEKLLEIKQILEEEENEDEK